MSLKELNEKMRCCQRCDLCKTRKNVVIGRGTPSQNKILFLGEGPGNVEDKEGLPFVGPAGKKFSKWIEFLGLKKEEYAISNVVKCFPSENGRARKPYKSEIEECSFWLNKQLEFLKPKLIVCLGSVALNYFIPHSSVMKSSGTFKHIDNQRIFSMIHPAYVLRNEDYNWQGDLKNLKLWLEKGDFYNEDALIIDIETTGLDSEEDEVKLIGAYSTKTRCYYEIKKDEITSLQQLTDAHYYLVGYNIEGFDLPFLHRLGLETSRNKIIDLYKAVKTRQPQIKATFENLKLATVCKVLEIGDKDEIDLKILLKKENTKEEEEIISRYLKQDVRITKKLYDFLETIFNPFSEYLKEHDVKDKAYLFETTGKLVYKCICNLVGLKEEYSNVKRDKYKGAYVTEPLGNYFEGNLYSLDFGSAYPNSFLMANLCTRANSKKCDCKGDCKKTFSGNSMVKLNGTYCAVKQGKVETVIKKLYKLRRELKLKKKNGVYALKILLNGMYGIFGSPLFKSVYNWDTASDCTLLARTWLKYARKILSEKGYKLIYSDTDSIYLLDTFNNEEMLLKVRDKIVEDIKNSMPFPHDAFCLEIENRIKKIWFFTDKHSNKGKKKHYVYITEEDDLIIKGLPVIKRNCSKVSKEILKVLKPEMIKKTEIKFPKKKIEGLVQDFLTKDISLAAMRFMVKSIDDYRRSPTGLYAQIAKRYGRGRHYLIKNLRKGVGKGIRYCSIEEAKGFKLSDLDLTSIYEELSPFIQEEERKDLFNMWKGNKNG